jgi:hypothetical protein
MRCRPMSETQMGLIPDPAQEVPAGELRSRRVLFGLCAGRIGEQGERKRRS